eukprot:6851396-Lingulodinium_polyedra.AAC.1
MPQCRNAAMPQCCNATMLRCRVPRVACPVAPGRNSTLLLPLPLFQRSIFCVGQVKTTCGEAK